MERKLSWHEAIEVRTSRRTYTKDPLKPNHLNAINQCISNINAESNLNFQLIQDSSQFFNGFKASYGLLKNVQTIIALVGNPQNKVQLGYYGEFLMLECVSLNLGTCWVGGTYNKGAVEKILHLNEGEELIAVITVGYVHQEKSFKEKLISSIGKNKQTFNELFNDQEEPIPTWMFSGIEAARLAPSAVNGKPVAYSNANQTVHAFLTKKNHSYEEVDLGISLAHFELGALSEDVHGTWHSVEKNKYVFTPHKEGNHHD